MNDLYRLVYTSRNLVEGTDAELDGAVAQILTTSQANNARADVTGALLFNKGAFAQVLEGPRSAIEAIFERIQRDARHSDVTVLQCAAARERGFPNWSMAFVGQSARGRQAWDEIAARSGFDHARLDADQVFGAMRALVLEEEGDASPADLAPEGPSAQRAASVPAPTGERRPTTAEALPGPALPPVDAPGGRRDGPDFSDVRAELGEVMGAMEAPRRAKGIGEAGNAGAPPRESAGPRLGAAAVEALLENARVVETAVLRSALADERDRTTALRNEIDRLRMDLLAERRRAERIERERDRWADRVRAIAAVLLADDGPAGAAPRTETPTPMPLRAVAT